MTSGGPCFPATTRGTVRSAPFQRAGSILASYVARVDPANTLWLCPSAFVIGNQFPLTYAANEGVHPWYGYDSNNLPAVWIDAAGTQYRTLKKINQFSRPSETVTIGDASQGSGAGTSTGWFDYTDTHWSEMNQISQANQLMKTVSNWGVNKDVPGRAEFGTVTPRNGGERPLSGRPRRVAVPFTLLKKNFADRILI